MASNKHQFLLGLVVKKMREEGFIISAVDGDYPGLFGSKTSLPPTILRHRPDVIGSNEKGQISIGEAKTENDLLNYRTYEQLVDFSTVELNGNKCKVYIGIPSSSKETFTKSLKKIGLTNVDNIHILYIPDEIIND